MSEYWHIIRCTSGQEGRAERYLERLGYPHGWHPVEKVRLSEKIYQRMLQAAKSAGDLARGKKPKRYKVRPYVHGYVFLPTDEVNIDKIKRNHFGAWMEVLVVNGAPYRLTDARMSGMKQVPDRVRELLDEAERAEREAWEAKRPVVGEPARVVSGHLEGRVARVASISEGRANLEASGLFSEFSIDEKKLERAA